MSKPSSTRLPWDIVLLVFKACDREALAVLGRVSLDFLASTVPILYRDVVLYRPSQLESLFYERKEQSRETTYTYKIASLLSLSHIQTLTLNFLLSPYAPSPPILNISSSRLPSSRPLKLDLLTVQTAAHEPLLTTLHTCLFPLLNPLTYHFDSRTSAWIDLAHAPLLIQWNRIELLRFSGGFLYGTVHNLLACVQRPSLPDEPSRRRRVVRFPAHNVVAGRGRRGFPRMFMAGLTDWTRVGNMLSLDRMKEGEVELVVEREEEKVQLEKEIGKMQPVRWRGLFRVVVEV